MAVGGTVSTFVGARLSIDDGGTEGDEVDFSMFSVGDRVGL